MAPATEQEYTLHHMYQPVFRIRKFLGLPDLLCMRLTARRQSISVRLAASRMQTLHALAAITVHSGQFFAGTLQEKLFE